MVSVADSTITPDSLRQKAQPVIAEATRKLVDEFHPEQIWLFGSYAWGEPNENSDLDFYVIVKETGEPNLARMQRAHRCLRGLGMSKDVIVSTAESAQRFELLPCTLTHKIFKEGIRLYGE